MAKFKGSTFQVGDVVKLVDIGGLYPSGSVCNRERLELNKDYTVCSVEDKGKFIRLIKGNGETEGVFSYRLIHAEPAITAESLRNSILSLQQERVSLQEKIEQNIAQEKALTEQLKELGFLLVESKEQPMNVVEEKKYVLYAEDIEEDMDDPYNWRVGDIIESISDWIAPIGSLATITRVEDGRIYRTGGAGFSDGHFSRHTDGIWKFHARPIVN